MNDRITLMNNLCIELATHDMITIYVDDDIS